MCGVAWRIRAWSWVCKACMQAILLMCGGRLRIIQFGRGSMAAGGLGQAILPRASLQACKDEPAHPATAHVLLHATVLLQQHALLHLLLALPPRHAAPLCSFTLTSPALLPVTHAHLPHQHTAAPQSLTALNPEPPADHLWWSGGNFQGGKHPAYEAPRCAPCVLGPYVPLPESMPRGCPCTPQALCKHGHPGLNNYIETCGIPRCAWRVCLAGHLPLGEICQPPHFMTRGYWFVSLSALWS